MGSEELRRSDRPAELCGARRLMPVHMTQSPRVPHGRVSSYLLVLGLLLWVAINPRAPGSSNGTPRRRRRGGGGRFGQHGDMLALVGPATFRRAVPGLKTHPAIPAIFATTQSACWSSWPAMKTGWPSFALPPARKTSPANCDRSAASPAGRRLIDAHSTSHRLCDRRRLHPPGPGAGPSHGDNGGRRQDDRPAALRAAPHGWRTHTAGRCSEPGRSGQAHDGCTG